MDPNTGKIYRLDDPDIPDDVRKRLIEVSSENPSEDEMREALRKEFVQKEADGLGEILDEMERVISLDDPLPEEKFYPTNRAARRRAEKLERKQKPKFVNKPGYGKVRDHG